MQPRAEGHARIERQHDGITGIGVGPRGPHEERADPNGFERRLPGLEPRLLLDLADREVADRPEAEGLEVAERIADAAHADARDAVVDQIRLHDMERTGLQRLLDRDAVVADATEDLAHRLDRLNVGRDRDLEPPNGLGVRCAR